MIIYIVRAKWEKVKFDVRLTLFREAFAHLSLRKLYLYLSWLNVCIVRIFRYAFYYTLKNDISFP